MTYSVVWSVLALQEAARVQQSAGLAAVRAEMDWIDYVLRRCPHDKGESRSPGYRLWYSDVLGVFYRVDDAAMRVEILFAGPARRR
jgi:hypothetical protein